MSWRYGRLEIKPVDFVPVYGVFPHLRRNRQAFDNPAEMGKYVLFGLAYGAYHMAWLYPVSAIAQACSG